MERGPVRLFGVSFERNTPGVIYNSLGLNGGQVQMVVRYFEKPSGPKSCSISIRIWW